MAMQTLYKAGALGPGAQVWVVPEFGESSWTNRVDWYLNYQITRAERHRSKNLPEPLAEIVQASELKLVLPDANQSEPMPLMVACSHHLPAEVVVRMNQQENTKAWVEKVHQIWNSLGRRPLRVFLPVNLGDSEFRSHWPENPGAFAISVVPAQ